MFERLDADVDDHRESLNRAANFLDNTGETTDAFLHVERVGRRRWMQRTLSILIVDAHPAMR